MELLLDLVIFIFFTIPVAVFLIYYLNYLIFGASADGGGEGFMIIGYVVLILPVMGILVFISFIAKVLRYMRGYRPQTREEYITEVIIMLPPVLILSILVLLSMSRVFWLFSS